MYREELIALLYGQHNATMASIVSDTEPSIKSPKTSGMGGGRIRKRSYAQIVLGGSYENAVNKAIVKEGIENGKREVEYFEPLPRKWGVRIDGTPLVEHKGKTYVEARVLKVLKTEYFFDGNPVDKTDIDRFLLPHKEGVRQGLDNPIIWRDYNVDSIVNLTLNGETIEVVA